MKNPQDKAAWLDTSEEEQRFAANHPTWGLKVNPEKSASPWAIDFILKSGRYADLKHEQTPFFKAGTYGVKAQYAFTINRGDLRTYPENTLLILWAEWPTATAYGVSVKAMNRICVTTVREVRKKVKSGCAKLHMYKNRPEDPKHPGYDRKGNEIASYITDLRWFRNRTFTAEDFA